VIKKFNDFNEVERDLIISSADVLSTDDLETKIILYDTSLRIVQEDMYELLNEDADADVSYLKEYLKLALELKHINQFIYD
jgi:hypothetical protein